MKSSDMVKAEIKESNLGHTRTGYSRQLYKPLNVSSQLLYLGVINPNYILVTYYLQVVPPMFWVSATKLNCFLWSSAYLQLVILFYGN